MYCVLSSHPQSSTLCLLFASPRSTMIHSPSMEWQLAPAKLSFLSSFLLLALVVSPAMSRSLEEFSQQKNYYPPSGGSSPSHSHTSPTPSHGGSYGTPTPSHGSHGSHGSQGSHGTPSTPSGGYYNSPPTSGGSYPSPVVNPPSSSTPTYPSPSTPTTDPHIPPFFTGTCKFWGSHPEVITAIIGSLGSIGDLFGHGCAVIYGSNPSLPAALTNTRTDGYGSLFREATASLLNSMVNSRFPLSTQQVKSSFASAITSDGAAGAQAEIFRQANEGNYKA